MLATASWNRSLEGLDGAPEWPRLVAMLQDVGGLDIVDLGCGYRWFRCWAAQQGCSAMCWGSTFPKRSLARARAETPYPTVRHEIADLDQLDLAAASVDLAYSSLAFHYVEDAGRLFAYFRQALRPGGRLVFSTVHPRVMASDQPGWLTRAGGSKTWRVDHYSGEGARTTDRLAPGVLKYHRMIATTLNLLIGAGFTIEHLEEFAPTPRRVEAFPPLADEVRTAALSACVSARAMRSPPGQIDRDPR